MKKFTLIAALLLVFVAAAQGQQRERNRGVSQNLTGTWVLVEYRTDAKTPMTKADPAFVHIKTINPPEFSWVKISMADNQVVAGASGIAIVRSDRYIEIVNEPTTPGLEYMKGERAEYTYTVSYNRAHFKGNFTGNYMEEVWEKVGANEYEYGFEIITTP